MLLDNGYSLELIFNKMNAKFKKTFVQNIKPVSTANNFNDSSSNNKRRVIILPCVNSISKFRAANIDKTKATIGFRCLNKLSQFVKVHKDKNPLLSKNNVIYKIFCNDCKASYVGQTKRQLKTRVKKNKSNIKQDRSRSTLSYL